MASRKVAFGSGRESRSHIEAPLESVEQRPCPNVRDRWMAAGRAGHELFRQRLAVAPTGEFDTIDELERGRACSHLGFLLPTTSLLSPARHPPWHPSRTD